jgi:hypothetical protein
MSSNVIKINDKLLADIPVETLDIDNILKNNPQEGGYNTPEVRVPIHTYDESVDKFVSENMQSNKKQIVTLNPDLLR